MDRASFRIPLLCSESTTVSSSGVTVELSRASSVEERLLDSEWRLAWPSTMVVEGEVGLGRSGLCLDVVEDMGRCDGHQGKEEGLCCWCRCG